jgi:hypothetical protein
VGGSLQSLCDSAGDHCRVVGATAESLCFLRRRAFARVGTLAEVQVARVQVLREVVDGGDPV